MAWTNYRNIVGWLDGTIDAEFVKASGMLASDGGNAELVVRFYPWWKHPQYLTAIEEGKDWGFSSYEAGKRDVTVRAVRPWALHLSSRQEVEAWGFVEEHPLLWGFAQRSTLFANAPFDRGAFFEGLMALALPNVSEDVLRSHIDLPDSSEAPLGLTMPAQLHEPVLTVFRRMGVPVYNPSSPGTPPPAVVFLIDDDYIIADDFEVDVPEFVHEPEWFRPAGRWTKGRE